MLVDETWHAYHIVGDAASVGRAALIDPLRLVDVVHMLYGGHAPIKVAGVKQNHASS